MSQSNRVTRRELLRAAAAMGATFAWGDALALPSRTRWVERRDLFAEGVASGDPASDSVILWTRASGVGQAAAVPLIVELADDQAFTRVIATARTRALAVADHTCRVLVGGLQPAKTYWYRFADEQGNGSRIGRTRTAPADDDQRPVRFAFVSCQNVCEGAQNAYKRMAYDDERAGPEDRLWFVLHLGDFVYEVVDYPEDFPGGHRYDRRLRPAVRYPQGEKIRQGFHIPVTLEDYRTLYRSYLRDPDLQDARARWPFVSMWDNHEFSWLGWQSFLQFDGIDRPGQTRKVMANQAWFEYQPARVAKNGRGSLERFEAPPVKDAPIERFDESGLGQEPNNLAAIRSLHQAIPDLRLWVDNGLADADAGRAWLALELGDLVLGSEVQRDLSMLVGLADATAHIILSLDHKDDRFLGPVELRATPVLWPSRIIAMTLSRVGSAAGPDLELLDALNHAAPGRQIFAAGGVRGGEDLHQLARRGVSGVLVATALHAQSIGPAEIAAVASPAT